MEPPKSMSLGEALRRLKELDRPPNPTPPRLPRSSRVAAEEAEKAEEVKLDPDQEAAFRAILALRPGQHAVLTGDAGTGKSTVIRALLASGADVTLCATTGRAAINIGAVTVDQLFSYDRQTDKTRSKKSLDYMMATSGRIIIIDEASMCGRKMTNYLHQVARAYGKILVFVGDWAQASPVEDDWATETEFILTAQHLRLTKIHRQTDARLLAALNDLRRGEVTPIVREVFGPRCVNAPPQDDAYLRLMATNSAANSYNQARLGALPSRAWSLLATYRDDRPEHIVEKYPTPGFAQEAACTASRLAHRTEFKVGARVVITMNAGGDAETRQYVNGDTGTLVSARVRGVEIDDIPSVAYNPFLGQHTAPPVPDSFTVLLDRTGEEVDICRASQPVKEPSGEPRYTVEGFPLMLGWAMTIHRAQGMTVDKAYVDIGSIMYMRGESKHGLAYVALSRTRTLEGLLVGGWTDAAIYCSPHVRKLVA
jgi:ATP-dependent DNA helicase PIF1